MAGISHGGDGGDPAVGVVEEAGHKGGLQNLMVVEAHGPELFNLVALNLVGVLGDVPGVLAQGVLLLRQHVLGRAEVVTQLIHQHGVLGVAPQRVAVGGQAVGAAVDGGDHHADHLLVRIGQVAGLGVKEGALEVQEADVLRGVQGQDLEEVVDEAPVLLHAFHVFIENGVFLVGHLVAAGLFQAGELFIKFQCHMHYSLLDATFRTPKFWKAEKEVTDRAMELLEICGLADKADILSSSLPYGQQRKLEIARALATNMKVLLLDEPAAGMNPTETAELLSCINTIRDRFGVAILLIEHDMSLVMNVCERIQVIDYGLTIASGLPEEIANNPRVIAAYLGE